MVSVFDLSGLVVVVGNISIAAAAEGIRVQVRMAVVHDNHGRQGIVEALDVECLLLSKDMFQVAMVTQPCARPYVASQSVSAQYGRRPRCTRRECV